MPLTRDDLRALRSADDSVSFYWTEDGADHGQPMAGVGRVRSFAIARKRHNPDDGFGERTLNRSIVLSDPIFTIYDDEQRSGAMPKSCYVSANCPSVNAEWQTVLFCLREGDELIPEWIGGNTNELMRKAGLTLDEFRLRVRRPLKDGKFRRLTFTIDHMVCQVGSPARMIR